MRSFTFQRKAIAWNDFAGLPTVSLYKLIYSIEHYLRRLMRCMKRCSVFFVSRPLVLTHSEPANVRRAFPCFDEPATKINFTLHMSRDPTHQSLSNMMHDHVKIQGHWSNGGPLRYRSSNEHVLAQFHGTRIWLSGNQNSNRSSGE